MEEMKGLFRLPTRSAEDGRLIVGRVYYAVFSHPLDEDEIDWLTRQTLADILHEFKK